jgi:myo-inositol 2-dehydrogenase/D-chiro-inositol 1-dehydrogenase
MQHVRVGVVGVGGMGTFHARTLASFAGVELVAVADPYEPNATSLRDELGCEATTDPAAVASRGLDGVVIASPDETHAELAILAMEHGSFVLCEKPLATTVDDAARVLDAEVGLGRRLVQLGFMREYDPAHAQVVAALGDLGRIDHVRAVHRNANAQPRPVGQIVGQSMVHDIHSVRFVTGAEIVAVRAFGAGAAAGSYRHVLAVCTLSSGGHATLEFDDGGFGYEVTLEALAEHGDAVTGAPTRATTRRDGSLDVHLGTDWFGWFADAYRIQDRAWVDSIRSAAATGPTTWDGLVAQHVVEAIVTSLAESRTVPVVAGGRPALYESVGGA